MKKIILPMVSLLLIGNVATAQYWWSPSKPKPVVKPAVKPVPKPPVKPVPVVAVFNTALAQKKIIRLQDLVKATTEHGLIYSLYINPVVIADLNSAITALSMPNLDFKIAVIINRIASDLSRGRVLPTMIPDKASIKIKDYLHATVSSAYLNSVLTPQAFIESVIPKNRIYKEAQNIVQRLVQLKSNNTWLTKPATLTLGTVSPKTVNPALISYIRARLDNYGYVNTLATTIYDAELKEAIKAFQADNKLESDGVAGSMSWKILEKPVEQLITQAILNLDRTRWLPDQNAAEYIYINLATQSFKYFENEIETLSFKTINGRLERQTPLLVDVAREVVLNPTWTVPRNLFVKDKIPNLQLDPNWSLNAHMILKSDIDGSEVDPLTVDWTLPPEQLPYTLVQSPGPWNALGFIKFPLKNGFAIYMHDTNERYLFNDKERLRSSGCMRLEQPFEVAEKLLKGTKWTADALRAASEFSPEQALVPTSLGLKRHVPVYVAYKTLSIENGRLIGVNDPYEIDIAMYNALLNGK